MAFSQRQHSKTANALLWTVQGVLAALFLFAGGMKLILPIAAMTGQTHVPGAFLRFIGVCEVFGALGLVLPGLVHLHQELTPLAARGLVIIMSGAIGVTLAGGGGATALVPLAVGLLAAAVAQGRGGAAAPAAVAPTDLPAQRSRALGGSLLNPAR